MPDNANKILVIVESIDVDDSSASKMNVALIENLRKLDYSVKVLHYTPKDILLPDITCIRIKELKFNFNYLLSRMQRVLQRLLRVNFSKPLENTFGFSFTYFNDVNSISIAVRSELKTQSYDLIITLSKGASFRAHKALLDIPKAHSKWMAYVHDPYPFCYYPEPYNWDEPGYKKKISFFERVSETAKYSAFPSQLLKEWMANYFPSFSTSGIIIPHQTNYTASKIEELPVFFDENKFNLLHAGNLLKQRDPNGLIEGYKLFLERNPEAKAMSNLLLLGPGSYHKDMLTNFSNNYPQIYWSNGNVAYKIVYEIQQKTTVNIILESKAEISPFLPGKFPHCVAANKPILHLGPENSETRRLLRSDYPYFTQINNKEKIAEIIEKLFSDWKKNKDYLKLNRPDLEHYVGLEFLDNQIKQCL